MAAKKGKLILPESVSLDETEQADFEKQMKMIKKKKVIIYSTRSIPCMKTPFPLSLLELQECIE